MRRAEVGGRPCGGGWSGCGAGRCGVRGCAGGWCRCGGCCRGRWAASLGGDVVVARPIAAGGEPSLVLYCALMIVATLGLFSGWAVVSWAVAVAALVAMLQNAGFVARLRAAFRLGVLKSKLIEVNLV